MEIYHQLIAPCQYFRYLDAFGVVLANALASDDTQFLVDSHWEIAPCPVSGFDAKKTPAAVLYV
jgi:hypothetical protein